MNNIEKERMSWDNYFMEIAKLSSKRSTCSRNNVGAVIVKDNRIVSTGYNGVPSGLRHCEEAGCVREELGVESGKNHELCRGLHAEQNAIINAANHGVALKGGTIYTTTHPCIICAKMIINAGIEEVVYFESYPDPLSMEMFGEADIVIRKLDN